MNAPTTPAKSTKLDQPSQKSPQKSSQKVSKKSSQKSKRLTKILIVGLLIGLVVFAEIVRPNQDAAAYTGRLRTASKPLEICFQKLADTTELDIYYAPDIALKDKQKDVKTINAQIDRCRSQLASFDKQAHDLLNLHFAGYTQPYREARVNQRQAYDVIGQSGDVLNQYNELAVYLNDYYNHIEAFLSYFNNLQSIESSRSYPTRATIGVLAGQANDLHGRALVIRNLKTPPSFDSTRLQTADMFDAMAAGFDQTVKGYTSYNDYYQNLGFKQVDMAVATYDKTVINLPFQQLKVSYVPKQVQQLPVKVRNLLAAQFE